MAYLYNTDLMRIYNYILQKGERTYQIQEISRGLVLKQEVVASCFSILADQELGVITHRGNFHPDLSKPWKLHLWGYQLIEKWVSSPSLDTLNEFILSKDDLELSPFITADLEAFMVELQSPTDLHVLLSQQLAELESKIIPLKSELKTLEEKHQKVKSKLQDASIAIFDKFEELAKNRKQIISNAQKLLALEKKRNLWKDIFQRLNVDIPILLPRISELLNVPPDKCETILKAFVEKDSNRGKYLELEQVFIKGSALEENLDELLAKVE